MTKIIPISETYPLSDGSAIFFSKENYKSTDSIFAQGEGEQEVQYEVSTKIRDGAGQKKDWYLYVLTQPKITTHSN